MVHFTQCSSCVLYIQTFRWYHRWYRITPFGNPGVNGYVHLTPAYRSLSRPSSPLSSKASAIDLYSLDHIIISASLSPFRSACAQACTSSLGPQKFLHNLSQFPLSWKLPLQSLCFPSLCFSKTSPKVHHSCTFGKWRIGDLNPWHSACKADALANWANSPWLGKSAFTLHSI